jgi:hypothetical protein
LVLLLVGVDLVIGPLLTLIVFRPGKRGLQFDLVTIGLLQSAALVYGMSVVLESRPVFLVGVLDRFELVAANEITDADLAQGNRPEFRSRSWTGPRLAVAELPTNLKERNDLTTLALSGRDVQDMPKYFYEYASKGTTLLARAKPLESLRRQNQQFRAPISQWLNKSGRSDDTVAWLPIRARKADLVMLLDAHTAQPLGALAIDPW